MRRIAALLLAMTVSPCPLVGNDSSPIPVPVATPSLGVVASGRKLAEAVNRVLDDIYSAPEGTGPDATKELDRFFSQYEKLAIRYGLKPIARRQRARFYLRDQYLLGVLDNGRWGISDRTLELLLS